LKEKDVALKTLVRRFDFRAGNDTAVKWNLSNVKAEYVGEFLNQTKNVSDPQIKDLHLIIFFNNKIS
jgi:ribosomal protein L5